ncbi:MAG: hypothetical protein JHC26_00815 [Thermofilum sp.]|jgi:hypothetical protein|uniref:hypothetical protein n=1 Tax=Thermofilum sp. TaxID=1961369 RepID=UPI00258BDBBF|nr:hypothetical protein [Thermofilum sp.]MCI4407606.1 hypothetical protein [Thermofilum sp.]
MSIQKLFKKLGKAGNKRRGDIDLGGIINMLLVVILLPTLLNTFGSIAGTSFGSLQPLLSAFTNILPIVLVFSILRDLFSGIGGEFGKVLDIFLMLIILPTLLNAFSGLLGGSLAGSMGSIMNVFMQLLPLIAILQLFKSFLKF